MRNFERENDSYFLSLDILSDKTILAMSFVFNRTHKKKPPLCIHNCYKENFVEMKDDMLMILLD